MSAKDRIVHLWDLPKEKVCVKLPDEIQKSMVSEALKIANGRHQLARKIGVKPINIYDFERCRFKSTTLSFIKKLSSFLVANGVDKFSLKNLESKVGLIKAKFVGNVISNPKFPMKFNSEHGAIIISGILFDGGISTKGYFILTMKNSWSTG